MLLDSDDRRLDAALRDAEEGFNVCTVCSFENFKRFKFCTVCGEDLVNNEPDEDRNTGSSKKHSTRLSFLPLLKHENKVELGTTTPPEQTAATRRRLRAQRRKEWTRKIDVDGRVYWFRDGRWEDTQFTVLLANFRSKSAIDSSSSSVKQLMAALIGVDIEEEPPTTVGEEKLSLPASECEINTLVDKEPNVTTDTVEQDGTHQPLFGSVEDCIATLVRGTQEQHIVLTPSADSTVDASTYPLDIPSTSLDGTGSTPLTETVSFAA
ncbi:hypothetical protein GN244_ATG00125 [Phytophthora infestans]|uniref:RanBP2-type domain-containing protein n=1 Tax=Phytophthora infestans TaxID=4787 RepID=A0A833WQW0_PHYIN|nr:hypothetical protein GN244_ATG00125 [Phytophthora infestans]KAF4150085.1 hypothetical protein GN958_ATG00711 [Phytophthora infestans]